jgi:beta-lactamase class A
LPPLALPAETINTVLQSDLTLLASQLGFGFRPHVLFYDPFSSTHAELNAFESVPSASVIKLPLLYLYGLRLASGVAQPTDSLLLEERHRVEGSGIWIGKPAHSRFSLGETAANMIQTSDNVATEMMLESLGGVEKVNQQWRALGYTSTRVRNQLPDKAGMNTVSMAEMVQTLMGIQHHSVFQGGQANLQLMDILEKTHNRRLIAGLLPKETKVFHKTGDIGKSLGESAMVQLPDGRYYYLAMMVERPHNNGQAADFIRLFSKRVYDYQVAHKVVRNGALMASVVSAGVGVPVDSSGVIATALPVPPAEAVEVF